MKEDFLLDPEITFLNHGSFGACPRPVFETYQEWQRKLERRPVEFLGRKATALLAESRRELAEYLHCAADDLVYFPNPTHAVNMLVRNFDLQAGDEVLTTDHEYGAMERTWRYYCRKVGAKYLHVPIELPVDTHESFVETFWQAVTPKTRIIFLSHITSPTALIFPVAEICRRARQAGILCIVDGAHAPGQIPLDLRALDADFYVGACHKWMLAPKGAAFLYARRELQDRLDPLVISWGYEAEPNYGSGNRFIDYHEWQGTRDLAAFLSVPAAIDYQRKQDWGQVRTRCRHLLGVAQAEMQSLSGMPPIAPQSAEWQGQMVALPLPAQIDAPNLQKRLYDDYRIEIPAVQWQDYSFLRLSVQGYNSREDIDKLFAALKELLI